MPYFAPFVCFHRNPEHWQDRLRSCFCRHENCMSEKQKTCPLYLQGLKGYHNLPNCWCNSQHGSHSFKNTLLKLLYRLKKSYCIIFDIRVLQHSLLQWSLLQAVLITVLHCSRPQCSTVAQWWASQKRLDLVSVLTLYVFPVFAWGFFPWWSGFLPHHNKMCIKWKY